MKSLLPLLAASFALAGAMPRPAWSADTARAGEALSLPLPDQRSLTLVWIPPGKFAIGSPPGEAGRRPDEGPITQVAISHGFWLGETSVTQGQYRGVMGTNPSAFPQVGEDAPVDSVSWPQAMEFARRLTEQESRAGRLPAGYIFGLPTEAQWEYACRAGTTTEFYNGESEAGLGRIAWYKGNAGGHPHPVRLKEPNAWGLYDMLGNLWQWCADWYVPSYPGGEATDLAGPPTGAKRNNRGGSWDNFPGRCRPAGRSPDDPLRVNNTALGFRLALIHVSPSTPARTSLDSRAQGYTVPSRPYVLLHAGDLEAAIVNHQAVGDEVLPQHHARYSGIGLLRNRAHPRNVFVPEYGGLNLELIQDGTAQPDSVLFETRSVPLELRVIDDHTAELYQPPTPHWRLESCTRFTLLPGGVVEVSFECVPLAKTWAHDYLGLSWASYIDHPESPDLSFYEKNGWVRHPTPTKKGNIAPDWSEADQRVQLPDAGLDRRFPHYFSTPAGRYAQPWMFGQCGAEALAFVFRPQDLVRPGEAHLGGGHGRPAWDFQWVIDRPQAGRHYRMVMRLLLLPGQNTADLAGAIARRPIGP